MTEGRGGVEALLASWKQAIAAGDIDRTEELVTQNAEFWSPGQPSVRGREELKIAFEPFFER
jgi:ketosteroid isomerase-like protein